MKKIPHLKKLFAAQGNNSIFRRFARFGAKRSPSGFSRAITTLRLALEQEVRGLGW